MSEQAKRAYEAHRSHLAEALGRDVLPDWKEIPPVVQEAWRAAVVAAVDSPPRTETLTEKQVRLIHEMGTAEIGRRIKAMMRPDQGFLLMIADYGGGNLAYISTIEREDVVRMLREFLQKNGAL